MWKFFMNCRSTIHIGQMKNKTTLVIVGVADNNVTRWGHIIHKQAYTWYIHCFLFWKNGCWRPRNSRKKITGCAGVPTTKNIWDMFVSMRSAISLNPTMCPRPLGSRSPRTICGTFVSTIFAILVPRHWAEYCDAYALKSVCGFQVKKRSTSFWLADLMEGTVKIDISGSAKTPPAGRHTNCEPSRAGRGW